MSSLLPVLTYALRKRYAREASEQLSTNPLISANPEPKSAFSGAFDNLGHQPLVTCYKMHGRLSSHWTFDREPRLRSQKCNYMSHEARKTTVSDSFAPCACSTSESEECQPRPYAFQNYLARNSNIVECKHRGFV